VGLGCCGAVSGLEVVQVLCAWPAVRPPLRRDSLGGANAFREVYAILIRQLTIVLTERGRSMCTAQSSRPRGAVTTCVTSFLLGLAAPSLHAQTPWWPTAGSVILGGGHLAPVTFDSVARRLISLAGGPNAAIVIIPTANEAVAPRVRGTGPGFDPAELKALLEAQGARHVTILHTRDRTVANTAAFVEPLRTARGVWITGGGSRILEHTYRGTRVARELKALLARGGVIFGDSAGAIALGCFMLGWTPDPWGVVVDGLSILPRAAIVPHANAARGYVPATETLAYLKAHPGPTGIAIDENTALVLRGAQADVIGFGTVALIDPARDRTNAYRTLRAGAAWDLAK